jgi:hypothetical protein
LPLWFRDVVSLRLIQIYVEVPFRYSDSVFSFRCDMILIVCQLLRVIVMRARYYKYLLVTGIASACVGTRNFGNDVGGKVQTRGSGCAVLFISSALWRWPSWRERLPCAWGGLGVQACHLIESRPPLIRPFVWLVPSTLALVGVLLPLWMMSAYCYWLGCQPSM